MFFSRDSTQQNLKVCRSEIHSGYRWNGDCAVYGILFQELAKFKIAYNSGKSSWLRSAAAASITEITIMETYQRFSYLFQ
jgi:hypothetical protein